MKKVLIIDGHPDNDRFNTALVSSYSHGCKQGGHDVTHIAIRDLDFNVNLKFGYKRRTDLEPDLRNAIEHIKRCEHLAWIHPVWWGGLPAINKGFIDRVFLPTIMFKYRDDQLGGLGWDKYLIGKTGRIITTMDTPPFVYRWINGDPSVKQLKKTTLEFCGVKPVRVSRLGPIKTSTRKQREQWLKNVFNMGIRGI